MKMTDEEKLDEDEKLCKCLVCIYGETDGRWHNCIAGKTIKTFRHFFEADKEAETCGKFKRRKARYPPSIMAEIKSEKSTRKEAKEQMIKILRYGFLITMLMLVIAFFILGGDKSYHLNFCKEKGYTKFENSNINNIYCSKVSYFSIDDVSNGSIGSGNIPMKEHALYYNINGNWSLITYRYETYSGFPIHHLNLPSGIE